MKAAVYYETGGPDVFRYEDVPDPACGPGSVLIDVKAISTEGGDTLHRAGGALAPPAHRGLSVRRPRERSARASPTARRDSVVAFMMNGSHAEQVVVPAASTWVLPDGPDLDLGPASRSRSAPRTIACSSSAA